MHADDVARLMASYATVGDTLRKSMRAFTSAIKLLLLPYRKGSNPYFTLAYALHVYSHTQRPQITKLKRDENVGSGLGAIIRNALKGAPENMETNNLNDLEAMLLSHVNAVRTNVARPKLQGLFDKRVRNASQDRFFIIGPIWWELLNAGSSFPAWAHRYRK